MEGNKDKALLLAWALSAGVAAGTAAAVTVITFPYAVNAAFAAVRAKRRRDHREHRHRHKSEKIKRILGKPKEVRAYRDAIRRSIIQWEDIDISFDDFPYFIDECTKSALLDSIFIYLKRPEYVKFTADLASVSPRLLLTGPIGSEMYQESLVQALAQYLQVNLLVFDSEDIQIEATKLSFQSQDDTSSIAKHDQQDGSRQFIEVDSLGFKEEGIFNGEASSLSNQLQEPTSAVDAFLSIGGSKEIVADVSNLGPHSRLHAKNRTEGAKDLAAMVAAAETAMTVDSSRRQLKKGDRVKYVGPSTTVSQSGLAVVAHRASNGRPSIGSRGRVLVVLEDNPSKVGVRFDKPVYGGNNLVDLCEDGQGCFCNVTELRLEHSSGEDVDKLVLDSLLEVLISEASKKPLILFIKNVEKSILGNFERYMKLERLEKTDAAVVIIGSHTSDQQKEKGGSHSLVTSKFGNNFTAFLDLSILDHFSSRMEDYKGEASKALKMLAKLFPTKVVIQVPQDEGLLMDWNRQLEQDMEKLKAETNRLQLRLVMGSSNVDCDDLASIDVRTYILTQEMAEKILGWAISHQLQKDTLPLFRNGRLVIGVDSIHHSLAELQSMQHGSSIRKKTLKDVVCENEFEKMLLAEVIPPDELGVAFDHIGALDNVKETLRELVMLPLQRPELFVKGQLTKPCRGLLLFGPPGTGKTMLAKAVATEAQANFINISMSTVASKWFGEAEKYVKAVFTLASKISPSVIFIDEVDSMLGRRGKDTEHSAMRKLKNEFMASWDGLRTRERERVLVLAATNRPFDLDEAVIRRFPRRLMIDLPDAENRAKILKVILVDEDLSPDFSIEELAAATDGYSGSDLKNLCTTAAYIRIRELLAQEKKEEEKSRSGGVKNPPTRLGVTPYIRAITMADMRRAVEKVRSSVASDAGSMLELQEWNEQYGEGGTRKKTTLSYFM